MCGLIAIIAKEDKYLNSQTFEKVCKELLYVGALRGFDSTGVCRINFSGEPQIEKDAVPAGSFLWKNKSNLTLFTGKALICHNRAATKGSITQVFAHPHQVNNITLVHNGTLFTHRHLAEVDSDSLALATAFSEKDPKDIIPLLNGSFALIWYDQKNKSYHWVRNSDRPLHLIETKSSYILVSELEMGLWILQRNNIAVVSTKEVKPYELNSFKHGKEIEAIQLEKKNYEYKNNETTSSNKESEIPNDAFVTLTKDEHRLADELREANIKKNDDIEVVFYSTINTGTPQSIWKKYEGIIVTTGIEVNAYSDLDLLSYDSVIGRITTITSYGGRAVAMMMLDKHHVEALKKRKNPPVLSVVEKPGNLKTINGIEWTEEIQKKVHQRHCTSCKDAITTKDIPESLLVIREAEITKPKFDKTSGMHYGTEVVKEVRYALYCKECVSFFSKADPNWVKRETNKHNQQEAA